MDGVRDGTMVTGYPSAVPLFANRILFRIHFHLGAHRGIQVHAQRRHQLGEIDGDVGQFLLDMGALIRRHHATGFFFRLPLENLDQLGDFHTERHGEVLWTVILAPVTRVAEISGGLLEIPDVDEGHDGGAGGRQKVY